MFEVTASLKEVLTFTQDSIPAEIYKRLCTKIGSLYPSQAISAEETTRLSTNLSCDEEMCRRMVESIYYLYSKVSYSTTKPAHIRAFLVPHIGEENAGVFSEAWSSHAADIVSRLKTSSTKYSCNKMSWGSTVSISKDSCSRLSDTEAVLQLNVDGKLKNVAFDFEGLLSFYAELEKIQSAIDNLA